MIHRNVVSLAMLYFLYLIIYFILSSIFGVLACSLSLPSAAGVPEFRRTDENCFHHPFCHQHAGSLSEYVTQWVIVCCNGGCQLGCFIADVKK